MPNVLDATGLTVATRDELVAYFTGQYQQIYGPDVNLQSDSPDGQMMNINIQSILDLEDLLVQIYNSFDPDNAIGLVLAQRCAINGIQPQGATSTVTPITVVLSQSVNLYGIDQSVQAPFTVADNAGNAYVLQETQLGVGPGTFVYSFQAVVPGALVTVPNTVTVQVTVVLGVTSVNNPTTYTTLGQNQESDANLKVRRQKSVSLASQGYLPALLAALENINGVSSAFVYENTTDATDGDGVPSHSIWVIVAGSAAEADIAQAIYTKRNAGCGMFGAISFTINQVNGLPFIVHWDQVVTQDLFISFTATSIDGTTAPNLAAIRPGLVTSFAPGVNMEANINELATLVQQIDPNTLVTNAGLSLALTQSLALSGVAASGTFEVGYNGNFSTAINWNDAVGTIQTKIRAVPGLAAAVVTGSIASQALAFDLSGIGGVTALLVVGANSLQTSGPAPITATWSEGYQNIIRPSTKKNQLVVSAANIVILPMILSPTTASVVHGTTQQMTGLGGYGTYTYSFTTNNSGGSINPSTGLYTAGATPSTDTLKVTDQFGNTATATITVT